MVGLAGTASAATLIGNWKLKGNFKNAAGTAVTMSKVGDVAFETVNVNGKSRKALVFDEGEGLKLTKVPKNARGSFSVSVWLEFDDVDGYRRIMSFGPNNKDEGLYNYSGETELYDVQGTDTQQFVPNQWARVHVTRNGKTGQMKVFVDGQKLFAHKDVNGVYKLKQGVAVFFQDDGGEHSSGTVAAVKVWRGVKAP